MQQYASTSTYCYKVGTTTTVNDNDNNQDNSVKDVPPVGAAARRHLRYDRRGDAGEHGERNEKGEGHAKHRGANLPRHLARGVGGLRRFVVERAPLGAARDGLAVGGGGEEVEVLAALALRLGLVILPLPHLFGDR